MGLSGFQFEILLYFLISFFAVLPAQQLPSNSNNNNVYSNYEVLDTEGNYILEWNVNWQVRKITFNVTVRTRGYIGFGLSSGEAINGADIVTGGVTLTGNSYFLDQHGVGVREVEVDPSQDWTLHNAWENSSHTFLQFSRAFVTCDEQHDYPINEFERTTLIWFYGETDNPTRLIQGNRGVYHVYLLDRDLTPRLLKEDSFRRNSPPSTLHTQLGLNLWTVSTRLRLPPGRNTVYQCTVHQAPRLGRKHHLVGGYFRALTEEARTHTHHMLMYRCNPPPSVDPAQLYSRFLNTSGNECFFLTRPSGDIPTQYCTQFTFGYGIGGRILFVPDHVGLPIGESLNEFYVLQVHYDNPERRGDIEYDINLDLFYTDKLRPNDGGLLAMGHHIPGSPSILLPPKSTNHSIYAHCGGECTQLMLPNTGINVAAVLLHTHHAGRKFRIQHFRGDRELPWIAYDGNYNAFFQNFRALRSEINVRPGDQLTVHCEYDTSWRNGTVVGGFSTSHEMCLTYVLYYNRLPQYSLCRSEIVSDNYMRRYLAGVNNITWDQRQLDIVASSPPNRAGQIISQISDNNVSWSPQLRSELQRDHKELTQVNACSRSPFASIGQGQVEGAPGTSVEETFSVSYPAVQQQYVPPTPVPSCNLKQTSGFRAQRDFTLWGSGRVVSWFRNGNQANKNGFSWGRH